MKKLLNIWPIVVLLFLACEKDIDIKPKEGKNLIVVEGHIETNLPPYVILTRSQTFFSSTDINSINNNFIRGAKVTVSDGSRTITLAELTTDSIPAEIVDTLSSFLGIPLKSANNPDGLSIVVYTTIELFGQEGRTYNLRVETGNELVTASTTIPFANQLDSVWTIPHPETDTLVNLYVRYADPAGQENFIRYFNATNSNVFYPPLYSSVLDDKSFFNVDGKTFDIPLEKGYNRYKDVDFSTYPYFSAKDTITLRWCTIDAAHFRFWSTAEYNRNNGGNPFSSPTTITSNIKGGLGIWGGYGPSYYVVLPKK